MCSERYGYSYCTAWFCLRLLEACCSFFLRLLHLLSTCGFVPTMKPTLFWSLQLAFLISQGILPSAFYTCDAATNPVLQHGFTGSSDLMPVALSSAMVSRQQLSFAVQSPSTYKRREPNQCSCHFKKFRKIG